MLKATKVKEVVLTVYGGAEIVKVFREAAMLALEEWRDVVFVFSGKNYRISPLEVVEFLVGKK